MSEKMDVARSIRNLATLYRDMSKAADALEAMGSIEQATEKAKVELAAAQKAAAKAKQSLDDIQLKAQERSDEVNAQISAAVDKAKIEAATFEQACKTTAETIVQDAREKAESIVSDARTQKDALISEISTLKTTAGELGGQIENLMISKADAEKQLADVVGKLEAMKGKLKAFLE